MSVLYLAEQLNQLNRDFYQKIAESFSATREQPWPGWEWLVDADRETLASATVIADVGCGNGRFGNFIAPHLRQADKYIGFDTNPRLLQFARNRVTNIFTTVSFQESDVFQDDLEVMAGNDVNIVAAFGIFHHLATTATRLRFLRSLSSIVGQNRSNSIWLSTWQFTQNTPLLARAVTPASIGMIASPDDEWTENDYILDWNRGGHAYRYCHLVTIEEMTHLCKGAGLAVIKTHQPESGSDKDNLYYLLKSGV